MIVTTHNAMLMNRYKKDQLIGVSVVYREKERGTSKFVPFVDLDNFSGILASGGLGNAMMDDRLISEIKEDTKEKDHLQKIL